MTTGSVMHGQHTGSAEQAEEDGMSIANIMGHGYADGYAKGLSDGENGEGSPTTRPIRMVVGHHHTGSAASGGGCYTEVVKETCGASINWTGGGVESAWENTYHYWATGTCARGHAVRADKYSPTGVDPGEIRYQPCRTTTTRYVTPAGHPGEGSFVRNVIIEPGETPAEKLKLAANEVVTDVQME